MVVDLGTMRAEEEEVESKRQELMNLALAHEVVPISDEMDQNERFLLPFNFIPLDDDIESVDQSGPTRSRSRTNGRKTSTSSTVNEDVDEEEVEEREEDISPSDNNNLNIVDLEGMVEDLSRMVEDQKERVREVKLSVSSLIQADASSINAHSDVQREVKMLLGLKHQLESAKKSLASRIDQTEAQKRRQRSRQAIYDLFEAPEPIQHMSAIKGDDQDEEEEDEERGSTKLLAATWQLEPVPLFFQGEGSKLKRLARSIASGF